jgi:hypothetical protein
MRQIQMARLWFRARSKYFRISLQRLRGRQPAPKLCGQFCPLKRSLSSRTASDALAYHFIDLA